MYEMRAVELGRNIDGERTTSQRSTCPFGVRRGGGKVAAHADEDFHHTTEDIGIALGQAVRQALGDMKGIVRYAEALMPMDETLSRVALDISGRPFLVWRTRFEVPKVGAFDTELVREFFQAFATHAAVTLHVETLYGVNAHHIAESCFKGLARVLRSAVAVDPRTAGRIPSTKGRLGG